MLIKPYVFGGIIITPENEWEEAYISNLYETLHIDELRYIKDTKSKFMTLVIIEKGYGDTVL